MDKFYSSVAFVVLAGLLLAAVLKYEPLVRFESLQPTATPLAAPD